MAPGQIHGVESLHELHLWQLSDQRLMATVHVSLLDPRSFMSAARAIKQIFHRRGIHATTVQPEILGRSAKARGPAAVASETDLAAFGEAAATVDGDVEVRRRASDERVLRGDGRVVIESDIPFTPRVCGRDAGPCGRRDNVPPHLPRRAGRLQQLWLLCHEQRASQPRRPRWRHRPWSAGVGGRAIVSRCRAISTVVAELVENCTGCVSYLAGPRRRPRPQAP